MTRTVRCLALALALPLLFACGEGGGGGGGGNDASFTLEGTFATSPRPSDNKGMIHFGLFARGDLTASYPSVVNDGYLDAYSRAGSHEVMVAGTAGDRSDPGVFNIFFPAELVTSEPFIPLLWADSNELGTLEVYEGHGQGDWNSLVAIDGRAIVELRIDGDRLFYSTIDDAQGLIELELDADDARRLTAVHDWRDAW
ncbi:MAG: hypothetical protein P1V51_02530 [Deltaproteobacteria bacterium]|nr:hypothetical protein [Deltaproteobacteria bacterium]